MQRAIMFVVAALIMMGCGADPVSVVMNHADDAAVMNRDANANPSDASTATDTSPPTEDRKVMPPADAATVEACVTSWFDHDVFYSQTGALPARVTMPHESDVRMTPHYVEFNAGSIGIPTTIRCQGDVCLTDVAMEDGQRWGYAWMNECSACAVAMRWSMDLATPTKNNGERMMDGPRQICLVR